MNDFTHMSGHNDSMLSSIYTFCQIKSLCDREWPQTFVPLDRDYNI